jgi:hypothetical protein
MWQLYTREPVWDELKNSWEIIDKVCSGERPVVPETVPIRELILDCWAADPVDRPSFKRIYEKLSGTDKRASVFSPGSILEWPKQSEVEINMFKQFDKVINKKRKITKKRKAFLGMFFVMLWQN